MHDSTMSAQELPVKPDVTGLRWYHMMTALLIIFAPSVLVAMIIALYYLFAYWPAFGEVPDALAGLFAENLMLITGIESLIGLTFLMCIPVIRNHILSALNFSVFLRTETYLYAFAGWMLIMVFNYFLNVVWKVDDVGQQVSVFQLRSVFEEQGLLIYALVFICGTVIVPIKEEIIFRGLIFDWFRTFPSRWMWLAGAFTQAVIFGVLHDGVQISAGVIGLVFALIYWFTRSLGLTIVIHMLINILGFLAQTFAVGN